MIVCLFVSDKIRLAYYTSVPVPESLTQTLALTNRGIFQPNGHSLLKLLVLKLEFLVPHLIDIEIRISNA